MFDKIFAALHLKTDKSHVIKASVLFASAVLGACVKLGYVPVAVADQAKDVAILLLGVGGYQITREDIS